MKTASGNQSTIFDREKIGKMTRNIIRNWCHTPSYLTLGELRKTWYAHMEDEPKNEVGYDNVYIRLLYGIIKPIENRLQDFQYVFGKTDMMLEEECRKYWDTVRIVFWFDS